MIDLCLSAHTAQIGLQSDRLRAVFCLAVSDLTYAAGIIELSNGLDCGWH